MAGGKLRLFACRNGKEFASKVAFYLNKRLEEQRKKLDEDNSICEKGAGCYFYNDEIRRLVSVDVESEDSGTLEFKKFSNGEFYYKIKDEDVYSVRGDKVYVIQLTESNKTINTSIHDNIFELIVLLDMLKRSSVDEINLILPILPYARQDVQTGREPVMTKRLSKIFEDGKLIDSLITVDVHSRAGIDNAYDLKKELLFASKIIIPALIDELEGDTSNLVFASTDAGGTKKAKYYAKQLGVTSVVSLKERIKANYVDRLSIKGDVDGKDVCFVDDMIDTGGTLVSAIEEAFLKGARRIYAVCTHPLFNGDAFEKFEMLYNEGKLKKIVCTDTVNHSDNILQKYKWLKQISVAELFAEVIFCSFMKKPVSSVYKPPEKF